MKMMQINKLKQPLFTKKPWGSEIIWALNDNFIAKTIDVHNGCQTPLLIHQEKVKVIKVVQGPLYLIFGDYIHDAVISTKTMSTYKLPAGWTWPIDPGTVHQYKAIDNDVVLEEISTPQLDDTIILVDEEIGEIPTTVTEIEN